MINFIRPSLLLLSLVVASIYSCNDSATIIEKSEPESGKEGKRGTIDVEVEPRSHARGGRKRISQHDDEDADTGVDPIIVIEPSPDNDPLLLVPSPSPEEDIPSPNAEQLDPDIIDTEPEPLPSPTANPSMSPSTSDDDDTPPTDGEIASCGDELGVPFKNIEVYGSKNKLKLNVDSVIAVKMIGDKNKFLARFKGKEIEKIAGFCFFTDGDKTQVNVSLELNIGKIYYEARGTNNYAHFRVRKGVAIDQVKVNLVGKKSKFKISGPGKYGCPEATIEGERLKVRCKK